MSNQETFEAKLRRIANDKQRSTPKREKSFIRDEVEFSVFSTVLNFIFFGGWYVLAGFAFAALAVLSVLGFIGFEVGALFGLGVALYLTFSYLSDS